jgi:FtsH-binding integral membrane protein
MSAELIDPRGPRFGAAITSALSLTAFGIAVSAQDGYITAYPLIVLLALLFSWSVFSPKTHPYGLIFKKLVRPRLAAPSELEDSRPPQFAQKVGLGFALLGLVGYWIAPVLVAVSAGFIFFAAFLNAFFNFCLGCQMYLGLKRFGVIR